MQPDLIYDVGMNDGADTEYYLSRGFRDVGIECSPVLAAQLREKFKTELADGRLVLLDVGVADENGEMEFWMSDQSVWSSFDREIASRNGTPHRAVKVQTRRFDEILAENGIPYFCKIDIEGHDWLCLEGMNRDTVPPYISIEMNHLSGDKDIERLHNLGYRRFKIIDQVTFAQPGILVTTLAYALPKRWSNSLRRKVKRLLGVGSVDNWVFQAGTSGAFGEDTAGGWHSVDWARRRWKYLHNIDRRYAARSLTSWFDIHAAKT